MRSARRLATAVILSIAACGWGPAHAQKPGAKVTDTATEKGPPDDLHGEWVRNGPGFVCKVATAEKLKAGDPALPDIMTRACLRMGPVAIGDDAQALTRTLGAPQRTIPQPDGSTPSIYFLEQAGQYPYFVAAVSKDRIVALQVTGPVAAKGYGFNHIDLGATTDTLVKYFGQPNHLGPSGLPDTDLWGYSPQSFSFEVTAGHVASIRIEARP
jgi:hypothetical protein